MTFIDIVATSAVILNIIGYSMRTMIPLRILAIVTNVLFIIYSILAGVYPTLYLHLILLPLNVYRLREMQRLVKDLSRAAKGDLSFEWLKPFTHTRTFKAGDVVFRKGDEATYLAFVVRGRFKLAELNIELDSGTMIGELGMLSPDHRRTQTFACVQDGEVLVISYDEIRQLQVQNPAFAIYFLQVVSARMFQNTQRLEGELNQLRQSTAPA